MAATSDIAVAPGKVTQIISSSMGFDDFDWGVDLFSDDAVQFKKLIYEMRFDEVSAIYAEFGVGHCWYVDPDARTMEVFALTGGKWLLAATFKDDDAVAATPFEVHTFSLSVLWPPEPDEPA